MKHVDFTTGFSPHPDTGDLLIRTNERAIAQAISNLLQTNRYERPFEPDIGGNFRALLFEQITPTTAKAIKALVRETIENNEKRIRLDDVEVKGEAHRNRYVVTLVYFLAGQQTPNKQQITLTRVR